jgi:hypothetical protein
MSCGMFTGSGVATGARLAASGAWAHLAFFRVFTPLCLPLYSRERHYQAAKFSQGRGTLELGHILELLSPPKPALVGVRPSPGAATFASSRVFELSTMPGNLELAAPGDGRTPAA